MLYLICCRLILLGARGGLAQPLSSQDQGYHEKKEAKQPNVMSSQPDALSSCSTWFHLYAGASSLVSYFPNVMSSQPNAPLRVLHDSTSIQGHSRYVATLLHLSALMTSKCLITCVERDMQFRSLASCLYFWIKYD